MRIWAAAALAMAGTAFGLDARVQWMKYDQAVAQAGMTGRPICVYVAVNPSGSSWGSANCTEVERSLGSDAKIGAAAQEFYMVRCADKATAVKVKSTMPPGLIFLDGDGAEFMRVDGITPSSIEEHMRAALAKYAPKEIAWATADGAVAKPTALVFVDERKESQALLAALSDRWLAKHHEKLTLVKHAYAKDDPTCKEYKVTSSPTIVLLGKDKKEVDRLVSKTHVTSVRAFLLKNFPKMGIK